MTCHFRQTAAPIGLSFLLVAFAAHYFQSTAYAEGFRIETKVFVEDQEEPVSQSTTLFYEGVVYDFLEDPDQIAVFRKPSGDKPGRFILLDPDRRVRTELSTEQLAGAMQKLKSWASRQRDPFLKFAANPEFDETFDKMTGKLTLASHEETYTIDTAEAESPTALAEYREFLDWYTKLNALLQAGPPPEPRLQVNAAIARREIVPVKVELLRGGEKEPIRAEHEFMWLLSKADLARIDDACASLAAYRPVENDVFLRGIRDTGN